MYYSQCGEDIHLYENYFKHDKTKDGFFIEIGGMDGFTYSNTLFFEQHLGWTGILIEPQVHMYNKLIKNRPNCYNFNYAISEINGEVEFIGEHATGGIKKTISREKITDLKLTKNDCYYVKSSPLKDVIKDIPIKKVDLFSIDVEGGELEVLKTFDWNIYVRIILIEMDSATPEKNEVVREFLREKSFIFSEKQRGNEIWINKKDVINYEDKIS